MRRHSIAFCLSIQLLCILGCQSRSNHLHYVVPDGFRGAIIIYTSRSDGVTLEKTGNNFTCRIPTDGVLRVKGEGPFYKWHTTSAAFADGQVIPVANEPQSLSKDTVAFWGGGSRGDGMIYDFIGTKSEHEQFRRDTATAEVKPGTVRPSTK